MLYNWKFNEVDVWFWKLYILGLAAYIYAVDTQENPKAPSLRKEVEAVDINEKTS